MHEREREGGRRVDGIRLDGMTAPAATFIRAAAALDAAPIHALHMAAIRAIGESHYTALQRHAWCGERTPQHYLASIATRLMRVAMANAAAERASRLLGFAQLNLATGAVEGVYVQPDMQRAGIGRQLLQALESAACGGGAQTLWLDASLNAVPFYTRQGYEVLSLHEHPVGPQLTIPCVRMRKRL